MSQFVVRQESFEGPLQVLLRLIEERKLPINSVSLATITDDYIAHTKSIQQFSIPQSADFVFVASSLLLIKSKSLLPSIDLTHEEEGSIEELERRLKFYKLFRDLSRSVQGIFGVRPLFALGPRVREPVFSPGKETSPERLSSALSDIIAALPIASASPRAIIERVVSLEEMIERLRERVEKALQLSFHEFSGGNKAKKVDVIIGFLALLELVKQGLVAVEQSKNFEDITMEAGAVTVPEYRTQTSS